MIFQAIFIEVINSALKKSLITSDINVKAVGWDRNVWKRDNCPTDFLVFRQQAVAIFKEKFQHVSWMWRSRWVDLPCTAHVEIPPLRHKTRGTFCERLNIANRLAKADDPLKHEWRGNASWDKFYSSSQKNFKNKLFWQPSRVDLSSDVVGWQSRESKRNACRP